MVDWLTKKNVDFRSKRNYPHSSSKGKRFEHYQRVSLGITEKFCSQKGKDIKLLRPQVSHSELNAIDFIWAQVKTQVAKKNTTFKIKDVQNLVNEALNDVTPENWKNVIRHTLKVEDGFRKIDFGWDDIRTVEPMVIQIRPGDSDSESGSVVKFSWLD